MAYDKLKFSDHLKWSDADHFNGCGANNAMINFSIPPLGGEQVLPLLGAEQTTSSLVVMILR